MREGSELGDVSLVGNIYKGNCTCLKEELKNDLEFIYVHGNKGERERERVRGEAFLLL